ncbi:ATP-binding protein [Actinokineospora pegani]|uniref:ATP-binding protein n=1 Tax=Actinokineospora pegani TaxID=2654637 RepID=UPI0012EAD0DD|nr:ATP-binding protein [Actinokineospora pegani]
MSDSSREVSEDAAGFAPAVDDRIRLRLAADLANLPVVRSVAGTVAAIADHDIDAISDLKLAVDEVCSTLITRAAPGAALECSFASTGDEVCFEGAVTVRGEQQARVDTSSFGWRVLTTLTDRVDTWAGPGPEGLPTLHIWIARARTAGGAA